MNGIGHGMVRTIEWLSNPRHFQIDLALLHKNLSFQIPQAEIYYQIFELTNSNSLKLQFYYETRSFDSIRGLWPLRKIDSMPETDAVVPTERHTCSLDEISR